MNVSRIFSLAQKRVSSPNRLNGNIQRDMKNYVLAFATSLLKKTEIGIQKLTEHYKKNSGKIADHASIHGAGISKTDSADNYATYYPFYKYQFDLLQNFLFGTKGYASTKVAARGMIITTYDILKQEVQHTDLFHTVTGWHIAKEGQPQPPVRLVSRYDNAERILSEAGSLISGSEFSIGTTSVDYTASDACGNTATCRFNITVEDSCCNNNPIIICPTDFNGCPQGIEPAITGNAIGKPYRVGCPEPVISFTDLITYQKGCSLGLVRTWLDQDPTNINLSTSCDQVIDLHDIESPNIICPANITVQSNLNCKAIVHWTEPTTSDNCSRVTLTLSLIHISEPTRPY